MKQRFFRCQRCGQITNVVKDTDLTMMCCMADMLELIPNTTDASKEKHVPVVVVKKNKIKVYVGEEEHPSLKSHYIEWICLQTKKGCQRVYLRPESDPKAVFYIDDDDEFEAAFAYCNLHGLWGVGAKDLE